MRYFILLFLITLTLAQPSRKPPFVFDTAWKTDTTKRIIDLNTLSTMLPRNRFPVLFYPPMKGQNMASHYFKREPVIHVEINQQHRAYPLNALTFHELVNDTLGGVPILVSYCPLCNSAMVYDRRLIVNGQERVYNFKVSGMLRNSDMVMWDAETESWWQQLTGQAIVGTLSGTMLTKMAYEILTVENYFKRYPDGLILDANHTEGRFKQIYGMNPYQNYDIGVSPDLFFGKGDSRIPPLERVTLIDIRGTHKLYRFSDLRNRRVINDSVNSVPVVLFYQGDAVSVLQRRDIRYSRKVGSVTAYDRRLGSRVLRFAAHGDGFRDLETNSLWNEVGEAESGALKGQRLNRIIHANHFAFAALAFFPHAVIFR